MLCYSERKRYNKGCPAYIKLDIYPLDMLCFYKKGGNMDRKARPGRPPRKEYPEVLTTGQAAEYLQVSDGTIRKAALKGLLPGRKIGNRGGWRFSKEVLRSYLEGGKPGQDPAPNRTFTLLEAAATLGVTTERTRQLIKTGELSAFREGGKGTWKVLEGDLEELRLKRAQEGLGKYRKRKKRY